MVKGQDLESHTGPCSNAAVGYGAQAQPPKCGDHLHPEGLGLRHQAQAGTCQVLSKRGHICSLPPPGALGQHQGGMSQVRGRVMRLRAGS